MIHYRFTYNCENLREEDFLPKNKESITKDHKFGFGLNSNHYYKVRRAREQLNLPVHEKETYDSRTGYYIDGTKIKTMHHEYHDKSLKNTETGEIYCIDSVTIQYHYGKYMQLSCRKLGSQSHATIIFENYSSKEPTIVEAVENCKYELIDKIEFIQSVDDIYEWFDTSDYFDYEIETDTYIYKWNEDIKCNIKYNHVYINDKLFVIEKYDDLIEIKKYCQNF